MGKIKKSIYLICFAIIISFSVNLKAESNEDHCHCVNAQQQTFEYLDDISSNEMSHSNDKNTNSQKEIIADTTISYREKRKMVMESFSNDQKKLIERYDRRIDTIRKKFNKSLSKKQRILITKNKRKRSKKNN